MTTIRIQPLGGGQTHDEELVEQVLDLIDRHTEGYGPDRPGWDKELAEDVIPVITRKAKEELLKQMMEPSAAVCEAGSNLERCPPITTSQADECFRAMLRTFATEQGLNVEKGEV